MVYVTNGIVLHSIKYSESSKIIKIYSELYGLQSYITKGFKKSKNNKNLIQPLTIVEIVASSHPKREIHLLKEINLIYQAKSLYVDIRKTSIVFFMDEILYKSIKELESNKQLFDFIYNSIIHLDCIVEKISLFNLFFIIQLTKYLGFYPELNYSEKNVFFDLIEGIYKPVAPVHSLYIGPEFSSFFYQITNSNINNYNSLSIDYKSRTILLDKICDYYGVHISGFKNVKSIEIFKKIFND
jgi:DNA repair protein RecO (recombination protein O)